MKSARPARTRFNKRPDLGRWCVGALLVVCAAAGWAQDDDASLDIEYAEHQPLAAESLLLDIRKLASGGYIAVGERGHVLLSADGNDWTQAEVVPTRSTLTSVTEADGRLWAAGHDSAIITSGDGGQNWTLQYFDPDREQPIMDIHFFNGRDGIAIGAYGLVLVTGDGGSTWDDHAASDEEWHYNGIADLGGGNLILAGEAGFSYRSPDGGETWETLEMPYGGSMFGIVRQQDQCVLAFGLRGHAQRSCDMGNSWVELDTRTQTSITGGTAHAGEAVLVGKSGMVMRIRGDDVLAIDTVSGGGDFAAVVATDAGDYLVAGENGVLRYSTTGQQGASP